MTRQEIGGPVWGHLPVIACQCGRNFPDDAQFCPGCGSARATPAEEPLPPKSDGHPPLPRHSRSRRLVAVGAALAVLICVGGAVALALVSETDKQTSAATDALKASLTELTTAATTEEIRRAGLAATPTATSSRAYLDSLSAAEQPTALLDITAALGAVAQLADVAADDITAWQAASTDLRSLDQSSDRKAAILGAAAEQAADNVDDVLHQAVRAYKAWQKRNDAEAARRDSAITAASTYQTSMSRYLDQYRAARKSLSDYTELVDTYGSTVAEGYAQLSDAAEVRRALRDQMSALTPPAEASSAHTRLLGIIDDGIAGVEAAQRGLDQRECDMFACQVEQTAAWQQFRSESGRITAALDSAVDTWMAAAGQAVASARAIQLPERPAL